VLPFFDEHSVRVLRVLTDNEMEYCGRPESHPYELYLQLNEIEHTRIRVRRPQTNGSVERLNQTIKDEFYAVAFRKKTALSKRYNRILMSSWITTIISGLIRDDIARAVLLCRHSRMARNYAGNMFMMRWTT
jgi:transposase InsO family protein